MTVAVVWIALGAAALIYLGLILAGTLAPAPADAAVARYFEEPFLSRAAAYQRATLTVSLLRQVSSLIFLLAVVCAALHFFRKAPSPSLPAAAGYLLLYVAAGRLLNMPFAFYQGYVIEHRFGLSPQTPAGWFADYGKSTLISLLLSTAVLSGFYFLITWHPAQWWFLAGLAFAFFLFLGSYLYPLLIDPLFYRFSELEDRELQEEIMALSRKAGIKVERILVAAAGRRTRKANAYFSGMGGTKRIVIYDTLLHNFTPEETLAVIAHEMGHWRRGHLRQGLLLSAAGSLAALYILQLILAEPGWPADFRVLPLALLFFALLSLAAAPIFNAYSRNREREADRDALALTGDPAALVSLYQKLARANLAVVRPHPLLKTMLSTHPPLMERIEMVLRRAEMDETAGKR